MSRVILSISLESVGAVASVFEWDSFRRTLTKMTQSIPPKDMRDTVKAASGSAVATLIGDYVRDAQTRLGKRRIEAIAVSAPGTIDVSTGIVRKSTRLGVLVEFDFRAFLKDRYGMTATVVNDADAAALGEIRYGVGRTLLGLQPVDDLQKCGDFAYVLVGEGVGCAIFINGRRYLGGGAAGHLGRMTIDPLGPISERFSSRGALESYASRDAVSRQMVAAFRNADDRAAVKQDRATRFDRILSAVTDVGQIPATDIGAAVTDGHPLAVSAIDEAARYLGVAIGALITIMNPPTVILGGDMIHSIPYLFRKAAAETEKFTWSKAWNNTRLLQGTLTESHHWGAAQLAGEQSLP